MSNSSTTQIVAFRVVIATGNDIGEMKKENHHYRYTEGRLPQYCLNVKDGTIQNSESYLQFVDRGEETYYMFDVVYEDFFVGEEISNGGLEDLVKGFDYREIFSKFKIVPYKESWRKLRDYIRVVYSLHYYGSYDHWSGGTEWDMEADIVGYFDDNFKYIEYEKK